MKRRVLILCTGNSARSQMAEGILQHLNGENYDVASAGLDPSHVRPEAITVMREIGIDISNHRSKSVEEFSNEDFDYVVTVCDNANESCPVFPAGTERIHWSFSDPAAVVGNLSGMNMNDSKLFGRCEIRSSNGSATALAKSR
jgi:arsenate reductase (thioredoxin)